MNKHLKLLGKEAEDIVTGYKGIITTISFDLFGCIQAILKPPMNEKGELDDGHWFDVNRLKIRTNEPVMPTPNFKKGYTAEGKQGAAEKVPMKSNPMP